VKININPTAYNYSSIYIISDKNELSAGCNGYYVQIGGSNKEISLWVQEGTKKTKIIDGADSRLNLNVIDLKITVTRDSVGKFVLKSKLASETAFVTEGEIQDQRIKSSKYFGLLYTNSSLTTAAYYFDDVYVTGKILQDKIAPIWNSFTMGQLNKLKLGFTEQMNFTNTSFILDQGMGAPDAKIISPDSCSVELVFNKNFEKGKIYNLQTSGLTDLAGNELVIKQQSIGIIEKTEVGDLIINEVMFENPENSLEYIEIYNNSEKVLDVSGLIFTTRKTDPLLFNTGNAIPPKTTLLPNEFLAICSNAEIVRNYHSCPTESKIVTTDWSSLNNESSTLVLKSAINDTVYDELTYNVKWHHALVKNPKGVALERINPNLPTQDAATWHSASSESNYGTPGYKNSQFREINSTEIIEKFVWTDPEAFSPDNDGVDDICFIRYKTDSNGYIANAVILNAVGMKVFQLASNILLSNEGFIVWDGRTTTGKNANAGIYILYFEMFNPENGIRKQQKLPIVVSSR
jgi:hypothetical protein